MSAVESLVFTVMGPDRPGLVESLAAVVKEHGGSWQQSNMAHLADQFAGVVAVTVPAASLAELREALDGLNATGLRVLCNDEVPAERVAQGIEADLRITGNDRSGIVHDVSAVLERLAINVERMDTRCEPAPMSGDLMFHADIRIRLLDLASVDALSDALEALSEDLTVDFQVDPTANLA